MTHIIWIVLNLQKTCDNVALDGSIPNMKKVMIKLSCGRPDL